MVAERYAVEVVGVASVTGSVSRTLDDLSAAVAAAATALDAALAAVAGEPEVSRALADATDTRRQTGLAAVARGGELVATVQQTTLEYAEADIEMAANAVSSEAAVPETFPFRMRPV